MKTIENRLHSDSLVFENIIWKILPDASGDFLIVETRDDTKRQMAISLLHLEDLSLVYTTVQLPQPWLLNLKAVIGDAILLTGYQEGTNPASKGVYVLDKMSGKLIWQDKEVKFEAAYGVDTLAVSKSSNGSDVVEFLSLKNGQPVVKDNLEEPAAFLSDFQYPQLYAEDNAHYATMQHFLNQQFSLIGKGVIEYLEAKDKIILSTHVPSENFINNHLLVLDGQGQSLHVELMHQSKSGMGFTTFFVCRHGLIFIKENKELKRIRL